MPDANPTQSPADGSVQPTAADAISDPSMVPMDDAAGGPTADPTADREQGEEPSAEEAAAQLGDFA